MKILVHAEALRELREAGEWYRERAAADRGAQLARAVDATIADQEVSFTDCVSFALMREAGIRRAFSFDRHFDLLGFQRSPA